MHANSKRRRATAQDPGPRIEDNPGSPDPGSRIKEAPVPDAGALIPGSRIQGPGSRLPGSRITDSGFPEPGFAHPGSRIQDPGISDHGSRNKDPGFPGPRVPGSWMKVPFSMLQHSWIPDPGSWFQDPGFPVPRFQDPQIQYLGARVKGRKIQDSRIQDACCIVEPGSWIRDSRIGPTHPHSGHPHVRPRPLAPALRALGAAADAHPHYGPRTNSPQRPRTRWSRRTLEAPHLQPPAFKLPST